MHEKSTPHVTPRYSNYVLGLLTVVYIFNLVDRSILSILQEPIKHELGLTDAQLGALTGLAFAFFYATLAIPIARFADKGFRKVIITASLGLWSLMTALCGMAQSFVTLLAYRIGVGVGEAGGVPPAVSLLSDYFPRDRRATAMAIYGFGPPIGLMFGVLAGGWLNEILGWRNAFYLVGVIGVCIVPIVVLTLRELPYGHSDRIAGHDTAAVSVSLVTVARTVWDLRSFRHLAMAGATLGFANYACNSWNPPFYLRVHELGTAEVGTYLGLLAGVGGGIGTFLGGWLSDRLGRSDARWYMWLPGGAMILLVPTLLTQYLVPSPYVSFGVAGASFLLGNIFIGPFIGTGQSLVQANMRATTQAILLMVFNIFGLSLGPFLTGVLSDVLNFRFDMGAQSLRYALCAAALFNLWAAFHFLRGARYLREDMDRDRTLDGLRPGATR